MVFCPILVHRAYHFNKRCITWATGDNNAHWYDYSAPLASSKTWHCASSISATHLKKRLHTFNAATTLLQPWTAGHLGRFGPWPSSLEWHRKKPTNLRCKNHTPSGSKRFVAHASNIVRQEYLTAPYCKLCCQLTPLLLNSSEPNDWRRRVLHVPLTTRYRKMAGKLHSSSIVASASACIWRKDSSFSPPV